MRKSNWIVAAIAAVACGVLLWAWFALGFNHVDDPLDLVVAVAWWLVVAAVAGGIVWAEGKRREKMRLAFVGEGAGCSPEAGLVMPDAGESELAALERTLSGMAFPDEVAALDERVRPAFRWVVRSRKFDRNGDDWEGEVVAAGTGLKAEDGKVTPLDVKAGDRILFGSDFPMWSPKEELERFLSLGLDEAEQQKILYGNFMNLLHLKDGA